MVGIDFSTHRPKTGYKMLLETGLSGQTGLPRLQAASIWAPGLLPPPPAGTLAGTPSAHRQGALS